MLILNSPTLSGDISGTVYSVTVNKLKGVDVSSTIPIANQTLVYNGSAWTSSSNLSGTRGTFSISVSAPALSGTFFGDGSRLTGVIDSTKLPIVGGTLTGNLSGISATFKNLAVANITFNSSDMDTMYDNTPFLLSIENSIPTTVKSYSLTYEGVDGGVVAHTNRAKWGTSSMWFSGQNASTANPRKLFFSTGGPNIITDTYTIEMWINVNSATTNNPILFNTLPQGGLALGIKNVGDLAGKTFYPWLVTPGYIPSYYNGSLIFGEWNHLVFQKTGLWLRAAVNGVWSATSYSGSSINLSSFNIGGAFDSGGMPDCSIEDYRITINGNRYTTGTNFTPPTQSFPTQPFNSLVTFTTSISAPALSGVHFGDGSRLANVVAAGGTAIDSTKLPVSGGNITGFLNVSDNFGLGTLTPTTKMHVVGNSRLQGNVTITGNLSCTGTQVFSNSISVSPGPFPAAIGNTPWVAVDSARNWYSVAMSSDGIKQTASVGYDQIYISTDSGNTWTPKDSSRSWRSVAMSSDGIKQTALTSSGQIYISTDSGNTWTPKDSNRLWRSVAMSSDGTKQTAVVANGQIYISTDSGNTWVAVDSARNWNSVAMSSDGTKQTAAVYTGQIYISTDSGNTWTPKDSSRNWWSVAMSSDGTKQTATVYNGQIYISTDSGNTWTPKNSSRNWYIVAMSSDGTKQTAVVYGGQIYISTDSGNTWTPKDSNRFWNSVAMSSDGTKQTAVVANGQIYTTNALDGGLQVSGGALNANTATFTTFVSAPALSGTFFGDGSKLTGITLNTSNLYTTVGNASAGIFASSVCFIPSVSGTGSWTAPANCFTARVTVVGGGGGTTAGSRSHFNYPVGTNTTTNQIYAEGGTAAGTGGSAGWNGINAVAVGASTGAGGQGGCGGGGYGGGGGGGGYSGTGNPGGGGSFGNPGLAGSASVNAYSGGGGGGIGGPGAGSALSFASSPGGGAPMLSYAATTLSSFQAALSQNIGRGARFNGTTSPGGGGGGWGSAVVSVIPGQSYTYGVGAAGTGASYGMVLLEW